MPSSSTGTTNLETQLRHAYQTAYVRLHAAHLYRYANFLTTQFALLLDTTEREMQHALHPELAPGHSEAEAEVWREDLRVLREVERAVVGLRASERVAAAADVLVDVGGLLEGRGWGVEVGERWVGWGRTLWEIAGRMWDDEEYFRR